MIKNLYNLLKNIPHRTYVILNDRYIETENLKFKISSKNITIYTPNEFYSLPFNDSAINYVKDLLKRYENWFIET